MIPSMRKGKHTMRAEEKSKHKMQFSVASIKCCTATQETLPLSHHRSITIPASSYKNDITPVIG